MSVRSLSRDGTSGTAANTENQMNPWHSDGTQRATSDVNDSYVRTSSSWHRLPERQLSDL